MTELNRKYPDALSRNLSEGGYTFLHRVFRKNMDTHQPAIMSVGELYLSYEYRPTDTTFAQGITLLEGSAQSETYKVLMDVVKDFQLETAFKEGGYSLPGEEKLTKKSVFSKLRFWE